MSDRSDTDFDKARASVRGELTPEEEAEMAILESATQTVTDVDTTISAEVHEEAAAADVKTDKSAKQNAKGQLRIPVLPADWHPEIILRTAEGPSFTITISEQGYIVVNHSRDEDGTFYDADDLNASIKAAVQHAHRIAKQVRAAERAQREAAALADLG